MEFFLSIDPAGESVALKSYARHRFERAVAAMVLFPERIDLSIESRGEVLCCTAWVVHQGDRFRICDRGVYVYDCVDRLADGLSRALGQKVLKVRGLPRLGRRL